MLLSIVIPAFDEEQRIGESIRRIQAAIAANTRPGVTFELIVCDNNSNDRTAQVARELGAKVVFEPINQISRARNKGAAAALGDWLLFVDADSYPSTELLSDLLDAIASGDVIGCGTTITVPDGTPFNRLRLERMNPIYRLIKMSGGACLLCEGQAFRDLDGFTHDLFALEEVEFQMRLKRYGRRRGKRYPVLHRHPVVTSGRKGELTPRSLARLFVSNLSALLAFALFYLLPRRLARRFSRRLLTYWYPKRR
ncbi:glycosyltransferase [Pelagicoccus sp. SDUM812003]|uniref:glycosyltransferase n=1 Tax=Pelagicoccus sp. SDUM812003 TaxID=3041267 RepID=UPI00280DAFB7|nr:glycosyltransferase [Pelagicoccus sp. SDUM812003]MDQ8203010.1 glycosyltransferase [Pelagicoccus sp. SDUM812003]